MAATLELCTLGTARGQDLAPRAYVITRFIDFL